MWRRLRAYGACRWSWWHVRHRSPTEAAWRAAAYAGAAGLAVWSASAFVRDEMIGTAGLPVSAFEAVAFAVVAWWLAGTDRWRGVRLGAVLAAAIAAVHLAGGLLRPTLSTFDADVEVVLGLVSLVVAVLVVRAVPPRRTAAAGLGLSIVVGTAILGVAADVRSDGTSDGSVHRSR